MRRISKTSIKGRALDILRDNEGTSIVLVTIIAIIIITGVVILRVTTGSLWASADKQLSQDQAYEMATSLGEAIDSLIDEHKLALDAIYSQGGALMTDNNSGLANSSVSAAVSKVGDDYLVTVSSRVARSEYVFTASYSGSGTSYTRKS